jgi:hypothetical protein
MEKLQINKGGLLHYLARFGGFPEEAELSNSLLEAKFRAGVISYEELLKNKRREWKDADFCKFSRNVVYGILWVIFFTICGSLIAYILCKELQWAYQCITQWKWISPKGPAFGGFVMTIMATTIAGTCLFFHWCEKLGEYMKNRKYNANRSEEGDSRKN